MAENKLAQSAGGSGPEIGVGGGPPGTTTEPRSARKRRPPGSYLERMPGIRRVKEYPLSESDMNELAHIGKEAAVCFSVASGLLGFGIAVTKDFSFSTPITASGAIFWDVARWIALAGAAVLYFVGYYKVKHGESRLDEIKTETRHDGES